MNLNEVIIGTVCFALILISLEDVTIKIISKVQKGGCNNVNVDPLSMIAFDSLFVRSIYAMML